MKRLISIMFPALLIAHLGLKVYYNEAFTYNVEPDSTTSVSTFASTTQDEAVKYNSSMEELPIVMASVAMLGTSEPAGLGVDEQPLHKRKK